MHRKRTKGALFATLLATAVGVPWTVPAAAAPPAPALQTVDFPAADPFFRQVAGVALPPRTTKPFSMLGVTWSDPAAELRGTVHVRTRQAGTGRWSSWQRLETDGSAPADRRGASDPLWVDASDGVEARITGAPARVPEGLRLDLINPDAVEPPAPRPAARRAAPARVAAQKAAVPMPTRPVPRMITRSGWGANETIVKAAPSYTGPVEVFFVHHTATGNGYSCTSSASIVRGIQAYQVRSRGWDDIGYNFLVDRCGTIFEGRGGGVGRSVLGAHTLGFNSDASAVAVIGNYDAVGVSPAVRTAIATVAAYKLGAFGNVPDGRVVYTSGGGNLYPQGTKAVLWRISGHRDAGRTECPGNALYAQLPAIRAIAGAAPVGLRLVRMSGAMRYGQLLFTKGQLQPLWDVTTPSALINRFEVWIDGKLAVATPGTHRTTPLTLTPGGHTVTVRALHLSGRSTTVTAKVVSDPTAPIFSSGPEVVLRPGSLNGSVPIQLGWTATDVNGLSAVNLVRPTAVELGTTAHSRNGTIRPAVPTTFTLSAADRAGNTVSASVTRTPVVLSEAVAARTGSWRTLSNPGYLGGVALGATAAGASASWTFTGRSAALAVTRSALSGQVRISVDGDDQGVVDLGAPATLHRQAIWAHSWTTSAEHTVTVQVEGTSGRPGAVLDGLVYLK